MVRTSDGLLRLGDKVGVESARAEAPCDMDARNNCRQSRPCRVRRILNLAETTGSTLAGGISAIERFQKQMVRQRLVWMVHA